jgi:uncharacterized protein YndB with AHSA1/START domain
MPTSPEVSMLKKVLLALVALIVVLVGVVATRPSELRVERSVQVEAPPAVVYARIDDLQKFPSWSPWERLDPAMKKSFAGTPGTVGQKYTWEGNDDVGKGEMTLAEAVPNDHVVYAIHFLAPFEAEATATITLKPEGSGAKVTWSHNGKNNFGAKAAGMFMNMDEMLGKDFAEGLSNLKKLAEEDAAKAVAEAKKAAELAAAAVPPPAPVEPAAK